MKPQNLTHVITAAAVVLLLTSTGSHGAPEAPPGLESLRERLTFHCSYDFGADADFARGDPQVYTFLQVDPLEFKPGLWAEHVAMEETGGRYGGALRLVERSDKWLFYRGVENIEYDEEDWNGTVSFWLRLDPDKDLFSDAHCSPIQIGDKGWNDAMLLVDFSKTPPRHLSFATFADVEVWNPEGKENSEIADEDWPFHMVKRSIFSPDKWTHVVFTFSGFNRDGTDGVGRLYIDGELEGEVSGRRQVFTWDLERVSIRMGLACTGRFDDLAIFDRALDGTEVKALYVLPGGVAELHPGESPQATVPSPRGDGR